VIIIKFLSQLLDFLRPSSIRRLLVDFFLTATVPKLTRTDELDVLIKKMDVKIFIEVGVHNGINLINLAKANVNTTFIGIDPYSLDAWEGYNKDDKNELFPNNEYDEMYNKVKSITDQMTNVTIHRDYFENYQNHIKSDSIDMIFIDALHDRNSVLRDIEIAKRIVKKGGIISGHNYSLNWFGVIEAVNSSFDSDNIRICNDEMWYVIYQGNDNIN